MFNGFREQNGTILYNYKLGINCVRGPVLFVMIIVYYNTLRELYLRKVVITERDTLKENNQPMSQTGLREVSAQNT